MPNTQQNYNVVNLKSKAIVSFARGSYVHNIKLTEQSMPWHMFKTTVKQAEIGKKDGSYFVRAAGIKRGNYSLSQTAGLLIIDGDSRINDDGEIISGAPDPELVSNTLTKLGLEFCIYTSYSNNPAICVNKWRLVLPCAYTRAQLPALIDHLLEQLHASGVMVAPVKENLTWSQPWYFPRVPHEEYKGEFRFFEGNGSPLNVDAIYQAWLKNQPIIEHKTVERKPIPKGMVSPIHVFNDQYNVYELLERNGYKLEGARYLSPTSKSGVAGIVVLVDSETGVERAYSHHGDADPLADSFAHDAFDLYRILECDGNEKKALAWNPDITKTNQAGYKGRFNDTFVDFVANHHFVEPFGVFYDIKGKFQVTSAALNIAHAGKFGTKTPSKFIAEHPLKIVTEKIAWEPQRYGINAAVVMSEGVACTNAWRGFKIDPVEGSVAPWLKLLARLVGNDNYRHHFISHLAHAMQRPDEKITWTIALFGLNGVGKNLLFYPFQFILEQSFSQLKNTDLKSNFSDTVIGVLMAIVSEASGIGNDIMEGLKMDISEEGYLWLNPKGQKQIRQHNLTRYYFLTNQWNALRFSTAGERRFFVLESSTTERVPKDDTDEFLEWVRNGGAANLFHYLLNYDSSELDVTNVPELTPAFYKMLSCTRTNLETIMNDWLNNEELDFLPGIKGGFIKPDDIAAALLRRDIRTTTGNVEKELLNHGWERWLGANRKAIVKKVKGKTKRVSRSYYVKTSLISFFVDCFTVSQLFDYIAELEDKRVFNHLD